MFVLPVAAAMSSRWFNGWVMQAVLKANAGPGFSLRDVPEPSPGPGQILLRVVAASVCGTDVHLYDWNPWAAGRMHPPQIVGHELCGEVIAHGAGVTLPAIGSRVAVESHIVCGHCEECLRRDYHVCANTQILGVDVDGCFASLVALPARNAITIDDKISSPVAAAMEPFGNAVHACSYGEMQDATVAVLGCGPIGCAAVAVSKARGARRVIALDPNPYRLELAEKMGADAVIAVGTEPADSAIRKVAGGDVDCALEMSGAPTSLITATRIVRPGGWISILGIGDAPVTLDISSDVVNKGLQLFGVIGRRLPQTWLQVSDYVQSGTIDVGALITHYMPMAEIEQAIALMKSGECGRVSLVMEQTS
jgi:threonine 3-dehydrogenase